MKHEICVSQIGLLANNGTAAIGFFEKDLGLGDFRNLRLPTATDFDGDSDVDLVAGARSL